VLRKFLRGTEGVTFTRIWNNNDAEPVPFDYTIDVPIANPDSLYIIAFVQDKSDPRRIYQTVIQKAPAKQGAPAVGVIDHPQFAEIQNINIYPNPVSKTLKLSLDNALTNDYGWHLVDQRGITILEGNVNRNLSVPQQIDVSELANGMYFMRISRGDKTVIYRKIAVLNSH
jgi:hypothetical protein